MGRQKSKRSSSNIQTTLRLPERLYQQAKRMAARSEKGESTNDVIVAALTAYLAAKRRLSVDAGFVGMSDDVEYQAEAQLIGREFAASDAETLTSVDRHAR